jgi:SAM-dependent methyltransferase
VAYTALAGSQGSVGTHRESPGPSADAAVGDSAVLLPAAPAARTGTEEEYCHELLGDRNASAPSDYDTGRRVDVLIDEFLPDRVVRGKEALDVGCGLGFFSARLHERGARVTACDIGPTLVEKTRQRVGCRAEVADALGLVAHFGPARFDLVVSSGCVEHTPDPNAALRQMAGVLRPGGYLAVSTPNRLWAPVVKFATRAGLRPFDGHENFSTWRGLRATLRGAGLHIIREAGLHLFPFQLGLHGLSAWCDRRLQALRGLMINLCVLARKPAR